MKIHVYKAGTYSSSLIFPDDRCTPNQLTPAEYAATDREKEKQMETDEAV